MFCQKCGNDIGTNENFCKKCGTQTDNVRRIKSYLAESIIVTILCCMPLGIVSIVYASKVSGLIAAGCYDEALVASNQAKKWVWISFWVGIIVYILWGVI